MYVPFRNGALTGQLPYFERHESSSRPICYRSARLLHNAKVRRPIGHKEEI